MSRTIEKINLAVFFGGNSVEHEISIISALQAMQNLDKTKYNVFPIYITKDNRLFYSERYFEIENFKNLENATKLGQTVTFVSAKTSYGTPKAHLVAINNDKLLQGKKEVITKNLAIIDIAFPIVHGTNVEDGTLAGLLQLLNLPYASSDVYSGALCMDKWASKLVLQNAGVPVLDAVCLNSSSPIAENTTKVEQKIGYPVIIKPVNLGSSVGISKATNRNELQEALELAFTFANRVIAERAVKNLREINCSVLGDGEHAIASMTEEVFMNDEILSYQDKYLGSGDSKAGGPKSKSGTSKSASISAVTKSGAKTSSKTGSKSGMASANRQIPADLPPEQEKHIRQIALKAFKELGCSGVVRLDFIIDQDSQKVYVNEVNTLPGSLAFYLWEATGMPYSKLLDKMIELAFKRVRDAEDKIYSFETNVLEGAQI